MSLIAQQFYTARDKFIADRKAEEGVAVMGKITALVNELGLNFNALNGGELAEIQMRLAGYKFYLIDYIAELNQISEALKLQIKEVRATRWDEVTESIKAVSGKVRNKEQIENIIIIETKTIACEQLLYENMFYKYRLKLSALDDILTAIVQRIAERKREIEQYKTI